MSTASARARLTPTTILLGLGGLLTLVAGVNYLTGVHGGAVFAGLGAILSFAFALLAG